MGKKALRVTPESIEQTLVELERAIDSLRQSGRAMAKHGIPVLELDSGGDVYVLAAKTMSFTGTRLNRAVIEYLADRAAAAAAAAAGVAGPAGEEGPSGSATAAAPAKKKAAKKKAAGG